LACRPVFRGQRISKPTDKGSVNRQLKCATASDLVPDRDHLMTVSSPPTQNRHRATTTQLPRTFDAISALLRRSTKLDRSTENAPHHHAAMTHRSSLRAAVKPIPAVGRHRSVITRPDWQTPAQATISLPTAQRESMGKLIFLAQSDDTDQPLPGWTRHPRAIFILLTASSAFQKRWITVVEKTTVFRSSAVSSAPRAHHPLRAELVHGHFHHTATPPRAAQTPRHAPTVPTGTQPLPRRSHPRRISASQSPPCPCPNTPTTISAAPNPTDWRASQIPDRGPSKVPSGMGVDGCRRNAENTVLSLRLRRRGW
jgi:hypothetical protein